MNEKQFMRVTSYVMQDDAMFSALTVRETLMVAAHFQLASSLSTLEKSDYVTSIISELGLNKVRTHFFRYIIEHFISLFVLTTNNVSNFIILHFSFSPSTKVSRHNNRRRKSPRSKRRRKKTLQHRSRANKKPILSILG